MPRKHEEPVTTCPPADAALQVETVLLRPTRGRRQPTEARPLVRPAEPRLPRVARLMALAIKFQDVVDRGEVSDYADIARLGYVTRARVTQIMNLLHLATDIQEDILFMRPSLPRDDDVTERDLRSIAQAVHWSRQRRMWRELTHSRITGKRQRQRTR